ncbi:MAG: aldo/keto reductase [Armatimonadetes bacterium]|nr:aldo/keto reductase [Armatimonadota bacterium]
MNRRQLLRLGGAAASTALLGGLWSARERAGAQTEPRRNPPEEKPQTKAPQKPAPQSPLPLRFLGETGQQVTIFGLGGASSQTPLSQGPREEAVAIIERALDLGVNYFDTAATYGNGRSERVLGEVAKRRRGAMFLASKSDQRSYDGAMRELEASLKRLQTDHLDLWQMHRASLADRDTRPAFASDGAIKALQRAKDEKIVRFAGVSGHHRSDVLIDWLERFPFDTLLLAINAADKHHPDSLVRRVLPVAAQKKVGVIAMKIPAYGRLLREEKGVGINDAMHYALSQSGVACGIIACDSIAMLEENVAAARAARDKMSLAAQSALEEKTASYWQEVTFYRRWT